jgi:dTDP-4-amino-4,6-dideoxygalactose transaminase
VVDTIRSGWVGTGPKTSRFETQFAAYHDIEHCIAVNSGTAALHLSLLAAGVGPGDEVIVPSMTFCATANAVIHTGATPVFADISAQSLTLDPDAVRSKITAKTRAIVPVHIYGGAADMDSLCTLAKKHNLYIVNDAAHAIETRYRGKSIAHYGDCTCYSFYVTKNLSTVEGGMIATHNTEWAQALKTYALHGLSHDAWSRYSDEGYKHYEVIRPGFKYNMTDIQASFGIHQLARIEQNLQKRETLWHMYDSKLKDLPLDFPPAPEQHVRHARHLYTIRVRENSPIGRDRLMESLHRQNIGTGVHYLPLHLHKYYRETFGCREGDFPVSEALGATTLSLPLSPSLAEKDIDDTVGALRVSFDNAERV